MISLLPESAEMWLGVVLLLTIVAVIARAAFSWRVDGRMNFLIALLRECPADDIGDDIDNLPAMVGPSQDTGAIRHGV